MPTRVQNRPAEMSHGTSEKFPEHDLGHLNRNIQHKEALSLRLALGSILGPKRPFTPSSRSSSGTASPAHPASFGAPGTPGLPPPPPNPTPVHAPDSHLFPPRGVYVPHTPSRLGQSDTREPLWPSGSPTSVPSSAPRSPHSTQSASPADEIPSPLALPPPVVEAPVRPSLHAPKPYSAPDVTNPCVSGSHTPKSKFVEALESKSAWDALIHGSFS